MSTKTDLQRKLADFGYQIGPYASKDTLSNLIRLHSLALQNTGVNVATLNDLDLRKNLTDNGHAVGPVTNHTRAIYQRKLLEVLTNEVSEGQDDEVEADIPTSTTPPRATRSSIVRSGDNSITSSPGRTYSKESQEPRIPLTRVDITEKNTDKLTSHYPTLSNTKPRSEQMITNSYSPQRSSTKPESRNTNPSYGLRDPYDFQNDEPMIIRHEHRATPFRTTNVSSTESFSSNASSRLSKPTDISSLSRRDLPSGNEINEMRSRIFGNTNQQKEISINRDSTIKKTSFNNELDTQKPTKNEKVDVVAKSHGTFVYTGITIVVALIVFVVYMLLVK